MTNDTETHPYVNPKKFGFRKVENTTMSSGVLLYNTVTTVDNNVLYISKITRRKLESFHLKEMRNVGDDR